MFSTAVVSTAVYTIRVVPLYVVPVCVGRHYRQYGGNQHYAHWLATCVKRFHRLYNGQPALPNRHYVVTTTTTAAVLYQLCTAVVYVCPVPPVLALASYMYDFSQRVYRVRRQ